MKKCSRCKIEKNEEEFSKNKNFKDGLWCYCKSCSRLLSKNNRIGNENILKEKSRLYRQNNPDKFKESCRKTYQKNRDKKVEIQREYYWENIEKIRLKRKELHKTDEFKLKKKKYYEKNKEKIRKQIEANKMVFYALKLGVIKKPNQCEICLMENCPLQGHHQDYSKPLEIQWVCKKCHRKQDKIRGK